MKYHNGNANKMVSDTPRTDEQINGKPCTRYEVYLGDALRDAWVHSSVCIQLERELNAANDRIKRLEEAGEKMAELIDGGVFMKYAVQWYEAKEAKP